MATTVFTLVGGISRDSLNKKLFRAVRTLAPQGIALETFELESLPFFSQDLEQDPPASVQKLRDSITKADACLFVTPEYNRSIPAPLKNALDWGSRPYGQSRWDNKTAAVMGASVGNIGTFGAQRHLREILSYLNMRTLGQPEFYLNASQAFDENGNLKDDRTREFITKFWSAFEKWIRDNKDRN